MVWMMAPVLIGLASALTLPVLLLLGCLLCFMRVSGEGRVEGEEGGWGWRGVRGGAEGGGGKG